MGLHTHGLSEAQLGWYDKYFGQLVGATILGFQLTKDEDPEESSGYQEPTEYFPAFLVKMADGTNRTIEISSDEEGNSGGWIFGLDHPDPVES